MPSARRWRSCWTASRPGWVGRLEADGTDALDELLDSELRSRVIRPAAFPPGVRESVHARARTDVHDLKNRWATLRAEFVLQSGWTLIILATGRPLWPRGFDPMNVHRVGAGEVRHTRYLRLGNDATTVELLDRAALTEASGGHPLLDGVRQVTIAGIAAEPSTDGPGSAIKVSGQGSSVESQGADVERRGRILILRLR